MLRTLFGKKPDDGRFPAEDFVIAETKRDGLPAIAMINRAYKGYQFTVEFPWHVEIQIALRDVSEFGLPLDTEANVLNGIEDSLEGEMKTVGTVHYIARETWNLVRTLHYYVADGEATEGLLSRVQEDSPVRPFMFKVEIDEHWADCSDLFRNL